jgi:SOS regulatory protein LexA
MTIKQAVNKLRKFFKLNQRMPSYSEMSQLLGFASKKASFDLAKKLIDKGYLEKDEAGKLIPGKMLFTIPLLGSIRAGYPDEAAQHMPESVFINQYLVSNPDRSYALKVLGDSMIEAGIHAGDMVMIEKDKSPREGDIIAAYIDNRFTLKHFRRIKGKICLVPANPKYPVLYPNTNLTIFGVVVSVVRKYH